MQRASASRAAARGVDTPRRAAARGTSPERAARAMSVVTVTFTKPGSLSLKLNKHEAGAAYLSTLLSKKPAASFANEHGALVHFDIHIHIAEYCAHTTRIGFHSSGCGGTQQAAGIGVFLQQGGLAAPGRQQPGGSGGMPSRCAMPWQLGSQKGTPCIQPLLSDYLASSSLSRQHRLYSKCTR